MRQSSRRDKVDNDFFNDYFRKLVHPKETDLEGTAFFHAKRDDQMGIKPQYGRFWRQVDHAFDTLTPYVVEKLDTCDVTNLIGVLRAYSRWNGNQEIVDKVLQRIKSINVKSLNQKQLLQLLEGLGNCELTPETQAIAKQAANRLKVDPLSLSLDENVRILNALCRTNNQECAHVEGIVNKLNNTIFDVFGNELTYTFSLPMLYESAHFLRAAQAQNQLDSDHLKPILEQFDQFEEQFPDTRSSYDPFKDKIVIGLKQSLEESGLEISSVLDQEATFLKKQQFPFKPDLVVGYHGKKVALFLTNDTYNQQKVTSLANFRHRITEMLNPNLVAVDIPIEAMFEYDLTNLEANYRSDFNIESWIEAKVNPNKVNIDGLTDLIPSFVDKFEAGYSTV